MGHDPWVIHKNDSYYYCYSHRGAIWVNKCGKLQDVLQFNGQKIWQPPPGEEYSKDIWAPELHSFQNKWYVYFAADDGKNENHRMYVLESETNDATGKFFFKGKIFSPSDKWAIDGTVLVYKNNLYFIWSGWEGDVDYQQLLYIAKMKNPAEIESERVIISKPEYDWEKIGVPLVNEGPQILKNNNDIFVIYSASGSWTNHYCLGQLKLTGDDPMKPSSWEKKKSPVFCGTETVFSPGHSSFTKSPDGTEDWIVYHAARHKNAGWDRNTRIQKFSWDDNGEPYFGSPVPENVEIAPPSEYLV